MSQGNFTLVDIIEMLENDLLEVNQELITQTQSENTLINDISNYIISSGGKRIRPIIVLLFSKMLGLNIQVAKKLAVICELIHTATILHDDVVDASSMRRGLPTANKKYNNPAAVLVGDFVYTRAFQLIADFNNPQLMKAFTDAVNVIAEGEVMQLVNLGDTEITQEKYFNVIYSKTARLFEVCCQSVVMLAYPDKYDSLDYANYGKYIGTAFQIVDDIIDYTSSSSELGKEAGDDLAEGKPTLPLIHLKEFGSKEDKLLVKSIILQQQGREVFNQVLERLKSNGSIEYCKNISQNEVEKAKQSIAQAPNNIAKDALLALADLSISRNY